MVRLGGVGTAPGWGGGGLISSPTAVLVVAAAGAYLECIVGAFVIAAVGAGGSVGAGGRAPGCGAGYGEMPVGGGAAVVLASCPFRCEGASGASVVLGVAPPALAALTGLCVKIGMGGIVSRVLNSAPSYVHWGELMSRKRMWWRPSSNTRATSGRLLPTILRARETIPWRMARSQTINGFEAKFGLRSRAVKAKDAFLVQQRRLARVIP